MSYRMILIDDEMAILQGLKALIDWEKLDVKIVGEAQNGRQGFQLIKEMQPDIVISDIAMPDLNGIDMLKKICENDWNVKVIFLSGYQEFEYARKALQYGAHDYLLKPVGAQDLIQSVEKMICQIQSEQSVHMLKKNDGMAEVRFQEIVQDKKPQRNTLGEFLHDIGVENIPEEAVCAAFRIIMKSGGNSEENKNLVRFGIYEFLGAYLMKEKLGLVVKKEYSICYMILFGNGDEKSLRKNVEKLVKLITGKYPADVIVGVGDRTDELGKISYLYKTAKFALELYFFQEKRYIDYKDVSKEYEHSLEEFQEKAKHVRQEIAANYHSEEILPGIITCVQLLGNIHYGNKNAVVNSCILFAGEIYTTLKECGLTEGTEEDMQSRFLEEIRRKATFQMLLGAFEDHYSRLFLKIRLLHHRKESSEIVKIKQYIREHYKENLTLEELAKYIGMNTSYMSAFFKKETGQNFKAYLTEIRMQEALKLMNSTDMNGYELAKAVGYHDVKQFRDKFREIYGVTPGQYRKRGDF